MIFTFAPLRRLLAASLLLAAGAVRAHTDLPADESVRFGELDNGLRYAIMPNAEPPGRVSLRLLVEAGSINETEAQRGLAHFLEHMAFNGSEHFPPGELVEYLQRLGMSFGADTNAHTGFDETVYKLELPENNEALLREGLQVLRDYAGGLLLREEEISRERGVILSEKRDRDSPGYRTFEAYWEFLFPDALVPQRFPIGIEKVIADAPRQEFVDFYETWYRPDNMAVVVVGEVDPAAAAKAVAALFTDLPRPDAPMPLIDLGELTTPRLATHLHSEPEAPATEVALMALKAFDGEPDSNERRVRELLATAANRMLTRRLEVLAKEPGAPYTEGSAYYFDYLDFFQLAGVDVTCQPEQWEGALGVIERELRRALEHGFTSAEVAETKAKLLNEYEEAVKAAPTRKSRELSAGLVRALAREDVFTSPQTDLAIAQVAMALLTPASAQTALEEIWSGGGRFLFVSGNLELDTPEAALRQAFVNSAREAVEPPVEEATLEWPYTDFGPTGEVVAESVAEDLGVRQVRFANGVRFNFKSTDFEANSVLINARFGGGELALTPKQKGLALLANLAFIGGGLEALSADELERVLAGQSVGATFSVQQDAFGLRGATTPEDFQREAELLAAYLSAPGYREEAARQARKAYDEMAIENEHTVEGVWQDRVARFLSGGSFRFGFPAKQDFEAQSMDTLRAWLEAPLNEAYLEVSVVGDIDYATALAAIAATFGALPPRQDNPAAFDSARQSVHFPGTTEARVYTFESDIPRALAAVYWPTTDFWDIGRTRRLNVLASVFRDRLRREVREKLGEGYSPYARNESSETYTDYGYLFGLNFADPAKVEGVAELIQGLGQTLGQGDVDADELQRALEPVRKFIEEYTRQNRYWLDRVLAGSSVHPEQLDWARTMASDYDAITREEINALAQEYLGASPGLPIIIKPTADSPAE